MSLSRRNLFRLSGAAGAGLAAAPPMQAFEDFFQPAATAYADYKTVISACGICGPFCGIQARVKDGVLQFLEGLPGDAHGGGHLCGKGASGASMLYDPDRLKYPMKRTNPRKGFDEDPGFVRITWQEAFDTIAAKITQYKTNFGAESLLFVTLPTPDVWQRFMKSIGVVNRVDHRDECFQSDMVVQKYTTGGKSWAVDFANSKYILLFGFDIVAKAKLVYANGILDARDKGAKVVHFSPNYTVTSRASTEYVNIRPGSDLAVALAMINVIVSENLYNKEFVDSFTNFTQFESQIRAHFAEYTPAWAESLSDVPADTIVRIAREFAGSGASVAPAHKKTLCANYNNGTQLTHAISILNILAGTIDRPGGRYFARTHSGPGVDAVYPPPAYPAATGRRVDGRDKLPHAHGVDAGIFSTLADGMLNKYPGMIKMAVWKDYTALAFPNPRTIEKAMQQVEFSVVIDFLPTDTASLADIVLPDTVNFETSDIMTRDYNAKYPQSVARSVVVPPMFEIKSLGYISLELGKRLAPDYFKTADGSWINMSTLLDEKTKRAGLGENFADFASKGVVEKKADFVPRTNFAAVGGNGKCQIYVPAFEKGNAEPLPKWHPKRDEPDATFPYYYMTFIPAVHKRNTTANNAILNEMIGENEAIINPKLAAKLNIKNGQMVLIRSRVGQIEIKAKFSEAIRDDAVMVYHGFGHRSRLLTKAAGKGVRDGDVIPEGKIDDFVAAKNYGAAACIMDAVVNITPL